MRARGGEEAKREETREKEEKRGRERRLSN